MSKEPLISIVIPARNEAAKVGACLDGIFSQTLKERIEVIVIDSGSSDGTLEILAQFPVQVHRIPPAEFNHGDTRNLGVRLARGEFVVMTVADARPTDDRWLERMLEHFSDPRVAGVCGQQVVPHDRDKNPLAWYRPVSEAAQLKTHFESGAEFEALLPREQFDCCRWDDVTAMYRRAVMLEIPYHRVSYSEDSLWARDALRRGWKLVYDYRVCVYHYHSETCKFRFKRTLTTHYWELKNFNCWREYEWPFLPIARAAYHLMKMREFSIGERLYWLWYNVGLETTGWCSTTLFRILLATRGLRGVERAHAYFCHKPIIPRKEHPHETAGGGLGVGTTDRS